MYIIVFLCRPLILLDLEHFPMIGIYGICFALMIGMKATTRTSYQGSDLGLQG